MRSAGDGDGRRAEWRLPEATVEEMRRELDARMDQETAEVRSQSISQPGRSPVHQQPLSLDLHGMPPPPPVLCQFCV